MRKIENAQKELCEFLIDMMPVEWSKICYYSKCTTGSRSSWIALIEKKTDIICTQESFWKRYSTYPYEEMVAYVKLNKLTQNLFNAYLEKFGEEKIWCRVPFIPNYTTREDQNKTVEYLFNCFIIYHF